MSNQATSFMHMNINELHERLNEDNLCVVDIRDANSFNNGRIPASHHLTNENLVDFIRDADLDAPLIVCCYHGNASQQAAAYMHSQDFTEVYSLDGGFEQWRVAYPELVESGA